MSNNINETQYFGRTGKEPENEAKIKVKGASGAKVNLRFAEMINDSGDTERGNDAAKGALYTIALRSAKAAGQYILSGDPTYITSYLNARAMIRKLERDELLEELVKDYLDRNE